MHDISNTLSLYFAVDENTPSEFTYPFIIIIFIMNNSLQLVFEETIGGHALNNIVQTISIKYEVKSF
jgi:hypothetical protein